MDRAELLAIYDREQRFEDQFPGMIRQVDGRVVRQIVPLEQIGFVIYSDLDEYTVDAEIDRQVAFFESQGLPFEWKVYDHDRPADLRQRLSAREFVIQEPEALMVLDMHEAPEYYWSMPVTDRVEKLTGTDGVDDVVCLEEEVWQEPHDWLQTRLTHDLVELPDQVSLFAVREDGRLVSAAWMYYHPPSQFASLWGGSTLLEYRGRGYYTSLLVVRAREARRRGYRFLTVDASPMSRPILEKHGFQFLGYSTPCEWTPKG